MRTTIKAAVIALGALGALAASPAGAQPYDPAYDGAPAYDGDAYDAPPPPAYDDAYGAPYDDGYYGDAGYGCDPYYGCPDDYYDLPYYDGQVYYDGAWLTGPFFYRDWYGGRQYWIHGGWHTGQYRGGSFRAARGHAWYDQHRGFTGGYRGGYRNAYRGYSQPRGGAFTSHAQTYRGGGWQNRQSFQPQRQAQSQGGGWHGGGSHSGGWQGGHGGGHGSHH